MQPNTVFILPLQPKKNDKRPRNGFGYLLGFGEAYAKYYEERNIANQIRVIVPRCDRGIWLFDDESVGLVREPFVKGIPALIDDLVADIPNARDGFRLLFSHQPFPTYQRKLVRVREEDGGNWYRDGSREGWVCPNLARYYPQPPEELFVKAEEKLR